MSLKPTLSAAFCDPMAVKIVAVTVKPRDRIRGILAFSSSVPIPARRLYSGLTHKP